MEHEDCFPYSISAVMMSLIRLGKSLYRHKPIAHSTICIWKQVKVLFDLRPVSLLLPIVRNPSFAPSNLDNPFDRWGKVRIYAIRDLYIVGAFASFEQLREKYDLKNNFSDICGKVLLLSLSSPQPGSNQGPSEHIDKSPFKHRYLSLHKSHGSVILLGDIQEVFSFLFIFLKNDFYFFH